MPEENGATNSSVKSGIDTDKKVRAPVDPSRVAFGQVALKLGLIEEEQLEECLTIQKKLKEKKGEAPKIGGILKHQGYLNEQLVQKVYRTQGRLGGHTEIQGFHLEEKIGEGSMGTVYRAHQQSMDRTVALKILSPKLARDEDNVEQFVQEARTVAELNHPHIVQGIDVGESFGVHYFVMEFVDGPTVQEILERGGAMEQKRTLRYVTQIAKALRCAHRKDMVHRDVKPANMMVNSSGNAKLCDLGLAQVLSDESSDSDQGLGTPNYLSPEQARKEDLSIQTDIYSLGASCYHMLTGRVPFPGDSAKGVVKKQLHAPLLTPSELNDDIEEDVERIIRKMMKKDRADRYITPDELIEDLQETREEIEERQKAHDKMPSRRPRNRRRR